MPSLVPALKSSSRSACERERSGVTEILANVLYMSSEYEQNSEASAET